MTLILTPLHSKHKLLVYSCFVLSKLSWHFTVADISKTWITEHLDSVVNGYIRKWLDIPISGTLSNVFLERIKFGLNICHPSVNLLSAKQFSEIRCQQYLDRFTWRHDTVGT